MSGGRWKYIALATSKLKIDYKEASDADQESIGLHLMQSLHSIHVLCIRFNVYHHQNNEQNTHSHTNSYIQNLT